MKTLILFALVLWGSVGTLHSQQVVPRVRVNGVVRTPDGSVIGGMNLYVAKGSENTTFATDIDGKFKLVLESGDYVVTVNKIHSPDFKLFLKVDGASALNPNNLVLQVDPAKHCCTTPTGEAFPQPLDLPVPPFPPAAKAVRASGEVVVVVKIKGDGSVESAQATSGHPLLRSSSVKAAKEARFEPGDSDDLREVTLSYVYVHWGEEDAGTKRYTNPFRVAGRYEVDYIIDTASNDPL